ncbi:uncharacterized protein F5891DRAFT_1191658 [Suillus fuscotomentosus]|uniref:Uncharacterized protein n=1 Tax=Suillus fuscotomentosus TaxID=1912939 RepID=A0AAD4E102_9AGAM|nr:uncharacterized protein F5891DRAFT_1191658 [Suillus fuscotomentosus]KAG1897730.1 hypothetical protein F5891DRAFT_1191658 [Suillus fuscotomentosus]
MSQLPDDDLPASSENYNALKRRIAFLEEQNADLQGESNRSKSRNDPYLTSGRAIWRLDQIHETFQCLIRWVPCVRKLVYSESDGYQLNAAYQKLNRAADSARGDDAASLKLVVTSWLNESLPTPNPPIHSRDKSGCGFYNDTTGELICPVDFKWTDMRTKEGIQNYEPTFQVTAHSWPTFLYKDGKYDHEDPTTGLFKGALLVRAFKHIFTSPSSAGEIQPDQDEFSREPRYKRSRTSGEWRTRSDVAALLGMRSVQPRAIAYSAVQFYVYILNYFEHPPTSAAKTSVEALLVWWNRIVFGPRNVASYSPQIAAKYSVANTSARC